MADDSDDELQQGRKAFERCEAAEQENRDRALEDIRFSRLGEQWPEHIRKQRELERRPVLTINKLPAFIRQVSNDARQNKPSIKVHPVDSNGDVKTADVINGLIRNIEYTSNADVAYDTGIEASVSGGFGYWRIGIDYAYDDVFGMDLSIKRVANQFSIYGDPDSMEADSSDWNVAFVVDRISKEEFKRRYRNKKNVDDDYVCVDFESDAWSDDDHRWVNDEGVLVAEWWQREEVEREILQLSDGQVIGADDLTEEQQVLIQVGAIQVVNRRTTKSHKVTQTIMTGADIIERNDWPGRYIPIVPIYGDEIVVEGKRYFMSLIHNAMDAQRMYNYWRTTATEVAALAPRVPWIGRKGTFAHDAERWATANTQSHPYLEYEGEAPQRQPLDVGPAAGALQEALNASDDMKAIIGLYDASLGARSNETSGRAIMARQREGDVATFHFIDNLTRAIRHTGRILIDLIPHVYSDERIIRVIGEDGTQETQKINGPVEETDENGNPMVDEEGQAVMGIRDLRAGKYDLTVTSGPSFTTRREEAAAQMTELVRAFPQAAPFIADIMAKNFDWPGAEEIAKRFEAMNPMNQQQQIPPQVQQMIEQGQQALEQMQKRIAELEADKSIDQFNAETQRMKVIGDLQVKETGQQIDAAKAIEANARSDRQIAVKAANPARQG